MIPDPDVDQSWGSINFVSTSTNLDYKYMFWNTVLYTAEGTSLGVLGALRVFTATFQYLFFTP